LRQQPL